MNDWPPKPGSTVMTSTMSSSSAYGSRADSGVPGLTASPAARPASRIARSVGAIGSSISTWNVIESQPASRYSSMKRPGSLIIRWASNGSSVRAAEVLDGLGAERQVRDEVAVHHVEVDAVGAGLLDASDGVGEVREVRVEDARRDPGPAVGHGYSPTPAGTGSWLRSPRSAAALSASRRSRRRATVGRRRLARALGGELAAGRADLLAAVAPDRRPDAGRRGAWRRTLDDGHRAGRPRRVGDRVHRDEVDVGVVAAEELGHRRGVDVGVVHAADHRHLVA